MTHTPAPENRRLLQVELELLDEVHGSFVCEHLGLSRLCILVHDFHETCLVNEHAVINNCTLEELIAEDLRLLALLRMVRNQRLFHQQLERLLTGLDHLRLPVLVLRDTRQEINELRATHWLGGISILRSGCDKKPVDCISRDTFVVPNSALEGQLLRRSH